MTPEQEQPRPEAEPKPRESLEEIVERFKQLATAQGPESALAKEMTALIQELEANIALERSKVVLETVIAAAHELTQPLTVAMGRAELTADKLPPDSPLLLYIQKVIQSIREIEQIINKMRAFNGYVSTPYADGLNMIDFDAASAPRVDKS